MEDPRPVSIQEWYDFIYNRDKEKEFLFLNYGYADLESTSSPLVLQPAEEEYRSRIQLYHHIAQAAAMTGKEVLEVGCGCGGGTAYIATHFGPALMKGLDLSQTAIKFCREQHAAIPNLTFLHGNAEALPFNDNSFDIIMNVESSHSYKTVSNFFNEVNRVLRPQGSFLFADLRGTSEFPILRQQLRDAHLQLLQEENITPNIIRALELDHDRKIKFTQSSMPRFLYKPFHKFYGTKNSETYECFINGLMEYYFFILQKG
ncbi:MAG: methyltransferase domain-containing protein [Chitinivibrionales bacterium]|nr:methyltransferase domain-containing protein [Chitinivibrionales bacterium]